MNESVSECWIIVELRKECDMWNDVTDGDEVGSRMPMTDTGERLALPPPHKMGGK